MARGDSSDGTLPPLPLPDKPHLRPIGVEEVSDGKERLFRLIDPAKIAPEALVPPFVVFVMSLLDGTRDLREVQAEILKRAGQLLPTEQLTGLLTDLDVHYFLDSPTFARLANAPCRPATHAGGAYAADPADLRTQLDGLFVHEKGPGAIAAHAAPTDTLLGLISPHIDLHRGGPCYAWAYKEVAERSQADLYVIFGTCHAPAPGLFALTRKDFETPLGTVSTDRGFVERLAAGYRHADLFAGEVFHLGEHSIEFQVLFLQYLFGGKRPFAVAPILVTSFHEYVMRRSEPKEAPEVADFVAAVRAAVAASGQRVCFVCGADLAHMGRMFEDQLTLTDRFLADLARDDLAMLQAVAACDTAAFFESIAADQDRRKVCGFPPIYTLLAAMGPAPGRLLKYDQWAEKKELHSTVTFASVGFDRPAGP